MNKMIKLRETVSGGFIFRLVKKDNAFAAIAFKGNKVVGPMEGGDADDVWRQLHDAVARENPLFIRYSSARARFLHFFPDGFSGAQYLDSERAYKLAAKGMLDKAAPLASVADGAHFG